MISISLHDVTDATPELSDGHPWVRLGFADGSRAAIHLHTFDQAVAIANAINAEAEARKGAKPRS